MTKPIPKPKYGYGLVYTSKLGRAFFYGNFFQTRKEARDEWLSFWTDRAEAERRWRRETRKGEIRIAKVEMRELQ